MANHHQPKKVIKNRKKAGVSSWTEAPKVLKARRQKRKGSGRIQKGGDPDHPSLTLNISSLRERVFQLVEQLLTDGEKAIELPPEFDKNDESIEAVRAVVEKIVSEAIFRFEIGEEVEKEIVHERGLSEETLMTRCIANGAGEPVYQDRNEFSVFMSHDGQRLFTARYIYKFTVNGKRNTYKRKVQEHMRALNELAKAGVCPEVAHHFLCDAEGSRTAFRIVEHVLPENTRKVECLAEWTSRKDYGDKVRQTMDIIRNKLEDVESPEITDMLGSFGAEHVFAVIDESDAVSDAYIIKPDLSAVSFAPPQSSSDPAARSLQLLEWNYEKATQTDDSDFYSMVVDNVLSQLLQEQSIVLVTAKV